ncbi:uncharacterized protein HD556DRAFT_1320596 [Suillus plorans]|uniref:Uncharacterized protein n=1 Tax=Suillus plorans TaxID=116603 RepID=A0A9P7JA76_9AGAM|nr:uncharacterized protein HD556DRAFT_1320596 [Suillus plorans]KAG1810454.1 hypothetical protein HD556DRAFT_1320596 [Suillus plorans]
MVDSLHASESTVSYPLHISGITVNFNKPKTNIESAEVRIGKLHSPIALEAGNRSLQRRFSPPMVLSQGDTFSLHIQSTKWLGMKTKHRDITFNPDDVFRAYSASERRGEIRVALIGSEFNLTCVEYTKIHGKINIVIDLSGSATTEVRICV